MGVMGYEIEVFEELPKKLRDKLPTVTEIEHELNKLSKVRARKTKKK